MAKKIRTVVTLQLPAGKATPAPPVGTALGPHGINIVEFTKSYNEKTAAQAGQVIPAQITIFEDRSFTFILKTPPAADMLRKAAGIDKGAAATGKEKAGTRHAGPGPGDRADQDGRPERHRHRRGHAHHRGHRALDGHRGPQLASQHGPGRRHRDRRTTAGTSTPRRQGEVPIRGRQEVPNMPKHGKRYVEVAKLVDRETVYLPDQAVQLLKDTAKVNFDPSVEAHIRLGVDPRHADQMVRGTVVLPHGVGKTIRVLVFAQGDKAREALDAGADEVGGEDLVKKIEAGYLDFDVALATPDMMGMVGTPRPHPGPPRPHAEPQVRHDHLRPRARDQGGQGRPCRVQGRQGWHHPCPVRQGQLRAGHAAGQPRSPGGRRSTALAPAPRRASTSRT